MWVSKHSSKSWLLYIIPVIIIMISVGFTGCVEDDEGNGNGGGNGNGNIVTLNSQELRYDWDPYQRGFDSLKVGDTLYLEDTIKRKKIEEADTYIELGYITIKVLGTEINNKVNVYDKIRVTLSVFKEKFSYGELYDDDPFKIYIEDPYKTYDFEWFKEDKNGFGCGLVVESGTITEI